MCYNTTMKRWGYLIIFFALALAALSLPAAQETSAAALAKPACNDRLDNDSDGKIDYPTDPGCVAKGDTSEIDPVAPPPPPPPPPPAVTPPPGSGWTYCVAEWEFCSFAGTKEVAFGKNTAWNYRTLTGGTDCTNAVFGDPADGVVKECWTRDPVISPPPPPPPSGYPASFFTGPAGQNIILPLNSNTAFLGVSPSSDPTTQAGAVESWLGRKLAIRNHFDQGNCTFDTSEMEGFRTNGWIPMVSWNGGYTPAQVRAGNSAALACIDQWAQGAKAWGHRFILRPWWEFNIGWNDGSYGNYYHSVGQEFIDAWRIMVNRATAIFGQQATWVWATYEGYFKSSMPDSYPGDAYVDVIATDADNFNPNWCGPTFGWCSWAQVGNDSWSTDPCESTYRLLRWPQSIYGC